MNRREFETLLLRYRNGECSEEEIEKIHAWFSALDEYSGLEISPEEQEIIKQRISRKILENRQEPPSAEHLARPIWRWISVAASVVVVSACLYFLQFQKRNTEQTTDEFELVSVAPGSDSVTRENTGSGLLKLRLHDGSKITLLPRSALTVLEKTASATREVSLEGNAFFDIEPDSTRPFFIYHGNLVTHVLGTSFWIKNDVTSKQQEVEVVTGVVKLSERSVSTSKMEVILGSQQKATYSESIRNLSHASKPIADLEAANPPIPNEPIYFRNNNLKEIATILASEFDTEIVFGSDNLTRCTFTGDVSNLPLHSIVELICKSIKTIHHETVGNHIVIYGDGCI